jgi:hypothetical protein
MSKNMLTTPNIHSFILEKKIYLTRRETSQIDAVMLLFFLYLLAQIILDLFNEMHA